MVERIFNKLFHIEDFRLIAQAETAAINAWQQFGGVDGANVDEQQIRDLLDKEAEVVLRNSLILSRGIKRLASPLSSFLGFKVPPLVEHPKMRKALLLEVRSEAQQAYTMKMIDTQEGRLEACLFFSAKRIDYENLTEQMGGEAIRRGRACTNAIELLLSQNAL